MIKKSVILSDSNNDWYLDANGHLAFSTDERQVTKEICQSKFWTILGEIFTDTTLGVDWFGIMFNENRSHQERIDEIKRIALSVWGVLDIEAITYEQNSQSGETKFGLSLITKYDTIEVTL